MTLTYLHLFSFVLQRLLLLFLKQYSVWHGLVAATISYFLPNNVLLLELLSSCWLFKMSFILKNNISICHFFRNQWILKSVCVKYKKTLRTLMFAADVQLVNNLIGNDQYAN